MEGESQGLGSRTADVTNCLCFSSGELAFWYLECQLLGSWFGRNISLSQTQESTLLLSFFISFLSLNQLPVETFAHLKVPTVHKQTFTSSMAKIHWQRITIYWQSCQWTYVNGECCWKSHMFRARQTYRTHNCHSLLMSSRSAEANILASASSVGSTSKGADSAADMLPMQIRSRRS